MKDENVEESRLIKQYRKRTKYTRETIRIKDINRMRN